MAKKPTGYSADFFSPRPSTNPFDLANQKKAITQAMFDSKEGYNAFFSNEINRPRIEESFRKKAQLESDNFKINSLRALTRNAYSDYQTADKVAGDFFNRLNSASNKEELNSIYGELEQLKEKATDNTQLFGLAKTVNSARTDLPGSLPGLGATKAVLGVVGDIVETAGNIGDYFVELQGGILGRPSVKLDKEKKLKSNKLSDEDFTMISRTYNPTELFANVKGFIDKKHSEFNAVSRVQNPELFAKVQKAVNNPSKQNAFDEIIKDKFLNSTTTRGNNYYIGSLDKEEQQKFVSKGLNALKNPGADLDNKYFKYDLENEALSEIQLGTMQLLQAERSKPKEEQNQATIKELSATLNSLETRRKEADKIYGVNKYSPWYEGSDRTGFWSSFGSAMTPIANLVRDDFSGALRTNASYKPEVIRYDKNGNPIMSNQFSYEKADGSTGYNWGSALEIGGQVIGQILPTLATSSLVGGLTKGLASTSWLAAAPGANLGLKLVGNLGKAAESLGSGYNKLNRFKDLQLADRLSTFATVSLTTMPAMIEQERKWGGDYQYRGMVKALIEGTTEGIGFPDVGALRSIPYKSTIVSDVRRLLGSGMTIGEKLLAYTHSAKAFGSLALKQNTVEALEEEMSLLGNAMFDQTLKEDLGDRPKEGFDSESISRTFVDSFIGGALYSGLSTGMQARATLKNDNLKQLTNWDVANNPELYKAHLYDMHTKNKIDDKQLAQGMQKIVELQQALEGMTSISRIKDMKTLLDDKDEQFKYFTNTVKLNNLLKIDMENLTEEDKTILAKYQAENKVLDQKKVNGIREAIAKLDQISPEDLTEEQKKEKADLTFTYALLKKANFKIINGGELSQEDSDYLTERNLIPNKSIEFTKEDLDREIKNVNLELLKTKKRIDQYDELTEQEKKEIIRRSYDDRIEAIQSIDSLAQLRASEKAVKDDLDYLKLKDKDYNKEDIENRERLYNAYADRAAGLTQRGEDGYNEVERRFEQENLYDDILANNDLFELAELGRLAQENQEAIAPDLYNSIIANINDSIKDVVSNLTNTSEQNLPEVRAEALYNFLLKAAKDYSTYLYDLEKVNEFFSWKGVGAEYTSQDLIDARERVIETRAAINSKRIATKESPYEAVQEDVITEAEQSGMSEEEVKDLEDLSKENKEVISELEKANKEVDESGLSEYKQTLQQDYENKKARSKTFPELAKIANNLKNLIFPRSTSFTSNYQRLSNIHNAVMATGDLVAFNASIDQLIKENPKNTQLDQYKDFVNRLLTDFPISSSPSTETSTEPAETSPKETITPNLIDGSIQEIEKQLTAQDSIRQNRLIQLASPIRTMAVEADKDNKFREDPAALRKVRQIDSLKTEQDDSKSVLLINRKDFMLKVFKEVKNLSEEESLILLNELEDFFRNNEEGAALPENISNILGSEFFEREMLDSFLRNNSKGFSTEPDVLITTVDKNNKLVVVEGYPVDLSVTSDRASEEGSNIPWNVSRRVLNALEGLGYSRQQAEQLILKEHAEAFKQFQEMKAAVKKGSQIIAPFTVSNGVMIKVKEMSREQLQEAGNQEVDTLKIEDFKLITSSADEAFGKSLQFEIGRLYVNVEGQPVLLSNKSFDSEEAAILVNYLFSDTEPEEFDSPEEFRKHLFNLINQADRKNRLYFKENPEYGKVEGAPHTIVIKSSTDEKGVRTYKQLTREELAEVLPKMYYKVSKDFMESRKSIIRYYINENGEVASGKQSYLDYLKDVHTFPTQNNKLSKPINKQIYFSPEIKAAPTPPTSTKTETPKTEPKKETTTVVTPKESSLSEQAVAEVKTLMPDAHKISSILTYEEAVEEHKKSDKYFPGAMSKLPSKDIYEVLIDQIISGQLPVKAGLFMQDVKGLVAPYSPAQVPDSLVLASCLIVADPENPSQIFRIYLSTDTTKGNHIVGVKASEETSLANPETVIVPKQVTTTPEDKFNVEEWADKTFGEKEETTTPVLTTQEISQETKVEEKPSVLSRLRNMPVVEVDSETQAESKEISNSCKTGSTQDKLSKVGQVASVPKITRKNTPKK